MFDLLYTFFLIQYIHYYLMNAELMLMFELQWTRLYNY